MNRSITERSTVSGDRAPGPDPAHQRADLAIGLAPYLWTSGPLVGSGVLGVRVLVGVEGAGDLAGQPPGRSSPSRSARSTIATAMRSLIEPPGLVCSTLATRLPGG